MSTRIEQLAKIVQDANSGLASYSDVKKLVDVLLNTINSFKKEVNDNVAKNTGKIADDIVKINKLIAEFEDNVNSKIANSDNNSNKNSVELKHLASKLPNSAEILKKVEDVLSALKKELNDIETRLTSDNIRNALELLEGDDRLRASAISGLDKLISQAVKANSSIQGASITPSPVHWPIHERFIMNGTDTSVTLQQAIGANGTAIFALRYQGQTQDLDTDYTVNGNKVTLVGFVPRAGKIISISYMP